MCVFVCLQVQKTVEALVLPVDDSGEDDPATLEDSIQIAIKEQDEDEEEPQVKKETEADLDNVFFRNSKLFDVDADEPEPDVCLPSQVDPIRKANQSSSSSRSFLTEINILKLAAQHKPSASWGKNSKRKAKMPAEILQSSESEEESSEPGKMVKKKKKKQEKKNKKLIKNKQEKKKNKKTKTQRLRRRRTRRMKLRIQERLPAKP